MGDPRFQRTKLLGLQAVAVIVKYRDKKTNAERLCRSIAAIRRITPTDTGIIYKVTLDTSAQRIAADAPIFNSVVRSFRLDSLTNS